MKNEKEKNKNNEEINKDGAEVIQEISIDEKRIIELEARIKEIEEKWKRALADYQNYEKRVIEQRAEWIRSAGKNLLLRILPVLDTLFLATVHSQEESIKVSIDQFLTILKEEGVVKIETVGRDFDPNLMEAISIVEGEGNKVVTEIRAGYLLFDKVLRPAQVVVGSGNLKN